MEKGTNNKKKIRKGFTLIEVLATIVILGIISLIAIPLVQNLIAESKRESRKQLVNKISDESAIVSVSENLVEGQIKVIDLSKTDRIGNLVIDKNDIIDGTVIIKGGQKPDIFLFADSYCIIKSSSMNEPILYEDKNMCERKYYINSAEGLLDLAYSVNNGEDQSGKNYFLMHDLDFKDRNSYSDPDSTKYGDINKDGVVESIFLELSSEKGSGFPPIGSYTFIDNDNSLVKSFSGNFDGFNYGIYNLFIDGRNNFSAPDYNGKAGLFNNVKQATIKNLKLSGNVYGFTSSAILTGFSNNSYFDNITITDSNLETIGRQSGLISGNDSGSIFNNIKVDGNIKLVNVVKNSKFYDYFHDVSKYTDDQILNMRTNAGGIAGVLQSSNISNAISNVHIDGYANLGGIAGYISESSVKDSSVSVDINTSLQAGGIGGLAYGSTFENISSSGKITGTGDFISGGLVYASENSVISNVSTNCEISGEAYIGGVAGLSNSSTLENVSSSGTANGLQYVSGISGGLQYSLIDNSKSDSILTAYGSIGQAAGISIEGTITNTSARGTVNCGVGNCGTFVGFNYGKIFNSYSVGKLIIDVDVLNHIGGFTGFNGNSGKDHNKVMVENTYYAGVIEIADSLNPVPEGQYRGELGTFSGQNGADSAESDNPKATTLKNVYSIASLPPNAISSVGFLGHLVTNAENVFNGGQINGKYPIYDIFGTKNGDNTTVTNVYSVPQTKLSGAAQGIVVQPKDLSNNFFKNTLKLGDGFKYTEGYYPQVLMRNSDGTYQNTIVEGQELIPIKR